MYHSIQDLIEQAQNGGISIAEVVLQTEMELTGASREQVYAKILQRWDVMKYSAQKAITSPQEMPGNLIKGQAMRQNAYSEKAGYAGAFLNRVMALAMSSSEVNASMGRICAAPTAGACGVLPAVLVALTENKENPEEDICKALLVASGIGAVATQNATVSGAEGGCQAECGVAAAMAAGAAVALADGLPEMVGEAVAITLVNCMGLVCDPVAGLVQLPCSFRNASQAVSALISADMALAGQSAIVPADEMIEAMYRVGKKLPTELKETALGGMAVTPTGKRIRKKLKLENK